VSEEISWSSAQEQPLLDTEVFNRLVLALGSEKSIEFANSYIEACKEQIDDLIEALNTKNFNKIEFTSHKLSSSTGTYGHMRLHYINSYIEECAMNENMPPELKTAESLKELKELANNSITALEDHLKEI